MFQSCRAAAAAWAAASALESKHVGKSGLHCITLVRPGPLHRRTAGGDGVGCDAWTYVAVVAGWISGAPRYVNDLKERLVGRHRSAFLRI